MGCWGITAFESDDGLDALSLIRHNLPEDGKLELEKIAEAMREDEWSVPNVTDGLSHTGPMALAEIIVKFEDRDIGDLDYDEEWAAHDNKFSAVKSFTVTKESVQWLRDYLSDTLKYAKENAAFRAEHGNDEWDQRGGWREEKDWLGWQNHLSTLVDRMNALLASPESQMELIPLQEQTSGPIMGGQSISRLEHGKSVCKDSPTLVETDIHAAVVAAMNEMFSLKTVKELLSDSIAASISRPDGEMSIPAIEGMLRELRAHQLNILQLAAGAGAESTLYDEEMHRVSMEISSLIAKRTELEKSQQRSAGADRRVEQIAAELDSVSTGIGTFDDLSVRQLVSFIKVIDKDKLLVCFKDGTEIEQIIQEV